MIDIYLYESDDGQLQCLKDILDDYISRENIEAEIILAAKKTVEFSLKLMQKKDSNPRLLFVDVQAEEKCEDGFGFVKSLRERDGYNDYIVLLSSQKEQAYKVFEYGLGVLDYILKDSMFMDRQMLGIHFDRIFKIIRGLSNGNFKRKLFLKCGDKLLGVNLCDIFYIQMIKGTHQVEVFLANQTIRARESITGIMNQVGNDFIMVSSDCLVSCSKVMEIDERERYMVLENGVKHGFSLRYLKNLHTHFLITEK